MEALMEAQDPVSAVGVKAGGCTSRDSSHLPEGHTIKTGKGLWMGVPTCCKRAHLPELLSPAASFPKLLSCSN